MDHPQFWPSERFHALRGEREFPWRGPGLWVCGTPEALERPCVAIVGTRAASEYGRRVARTFAHALAAAGCTVVSGLALGIDAAAHLGALDAGGATVGVLGSGHARLFPSRNAALAQRMLASGAVLSPYEPERRAFPHQFLERNAVVAALSDAVVVVEAPARSGALNTAGWAAGRIPVFVVPADIDRVGFAGSHALLRDGATLACGSADVLEGLHVALPPQPSTRTGTAGAVLDALARGESTLETLVESTGLRSAELLADLALLELEGLIERREGARYARLLQ